MTEADGSSTQWRYDDAYRLTGETRRDGSGAVTAQASYTYDAAGNRTAMTAGGQTTTYSYNALDQLTNAGAKQYSYDGRGNLVGVTDGAAATSYRYDAADRLTGATLPDGSGIGYGYDADGYRVSQTTGANVTNYLWDPTSAYGDVVRESDGSGATTASYALGGEVLSQTRGGATSYYLQDGQGSTRALTDANGNVTDRYSYDAYGTVTSYQGATVNSYLYDGQQYDASTGLYSLRARYYDPTLGRFTSQDTAGFDLQSPTNLHRYRYASCDPVNRSDPGGHADDVEYGALIRNAQAEDEAALAQIEARENQCGVKFLVDNATGLLNGYFTIQQGTDFYNLYPSGTGVPLNMPLGPDGAVPTGNIPSPNDVYTLLAGDTYKDARTANDTFNAGLHNSYNDSGYNIRGMDVHEPAPVKFGGCVNCLENKIALEKEVHKPFTEWWRQLRDCLLKLKPYDYAKLGG